MFEKKPAVAKADASLKDLQGLAIKEGLPESEVETFKTKDSLISAIRLQREKKQVEEKAEKQVEAMKTEVKEAKAQDTRVASLEEAPKPAEMKADNKRWTDKASRMREKLLAQEKTIMMLDLRPGEKPGVVHDLYDKNGNFYQQHVSGAVEPVQLNGFKYLVPRGVQARVPVQIAEVLGASMQLTQQAGREWLIDRVDPQTGKPMSEAF